jgi:predicted HicB family RNase H-like nuclease
MKGKFEISGRTTEQTAPSPMDEAMDRFVSGAEPMTTMTVQVPERLKYALKQAALDRKTSVKALVIEIIEAHLEAIKQ